jgi:hypothetical protein
VATAWKRMESSSSSSSRDDNFSEMERIAFLSRRVRNWTFRRKVFCA